MLKLPIHLHKLRFTPRFTSVVVAVLWCLYTWLTPANVYQMHVLMGMVLCAGIFSYFLTKQFNFFIGLCYLYFSLNSLIRIVFPAVSWPQAIPDPGVMVGFESLVSSAFLYLTLIAIAACALKNQLEHIEMFFLNLALIDALVLCCKFLYLIIKTGKFHDFDYYFVMNNASIDATFIACVLPLALNLLNLWKHWQYKVFLAILIAPLFFTYSSSGIMGLGLALGMFIWSKKKFSLPATIYGGAVSLAVAMIGWLIQRQGLIASSGRSHIWKLAITYWRQNDIKLFGSGSGTWYMIGPALQMNEILGQGGDKIDAFFWMHNDWLQIAFENGLIGLALVFILWLWVIFKTRHTPKIFASTIVFGCLAFVQMPMRHFILTSFGAFLLTYAVSPFAINPPEKSSNREI